MGIQASDHGSGTISDLYFDDATWIVRYLVVDTGGWLSGRRQVLISPEALTGIDVNARLFQTKLTEEQIRNSPRSNSEQTVSRQQEELLSQYYGWSPYWLTPASVYPFPGTYTYPPYPAGVSRTREMLTGTLPSGIDEAARARVEAIKNQEIHLRSFQEIKSYGLRASDGDIGEVDDLLVDSTDWQVTHFIVDSRRWWPGGQVVIDKGMVEDIIWSDRRISVAMNQDQVKQAPPYNREMSLTEAFQTEVSQYYKSLESNRHGVLAQTMPDLGQGPSAHV
jgi:hypothetical protein